MNKNDTSTSSEIRRLMIACDKDMMAECRKHKLPDEVAHSLTSDIWMLLKTKLVLQGEEELEAAQRKGYQLGFKAGLERRSSFDRMAYENRIANAGEIQGNA